jgi:transposase InsO family protein
MCRTLGVARQGFYQWLESPEGVRKKEDKKLLAKIEKIFVENRSVYGPARIAEQLRKDGTPCGKTRVKRLMEAAGLRPKRRTKFKKTTNSKHNRKVAPNLVDQDFSATRPDQLWASDIAYIQTLRGTLYLAIVLDVFSRKIVGWSMQERMKDRLVIDAFNSAWDSRRPGNGLIFHSDRGSQYCSGDFIKILEAKNCDQSMSSTGNCYDNAISETFFKTLRAELTYHIRFNGRDEARKEIFSYIELFYNRKRLHSALDYHSPEEYERLEMKEAA